MVAGRGGRAPIDATDIQPVLEDMDRGVPIIIAEAPPGAGKTVLAAACLAHAIDRMQPAIYVATSYEQNRAMCRKLQSVFPGLSEKITIYGSESAKGKHMPGFLRERIDFATKAKALEEAIHKKRAVATVLSKLRKGRVALDKDHPEKHFRWMIIDEAWQITDSDFGYIAPLADSFVLIGDRGQIQPIVVGDISRWREDPAGPHRPAPEALLARSHPPGRISLRPMGRSRRLPERSARVVQRIFYPSLPFPGSAEPRLLEAGAPTGHTGADQAIAAACSADPAPFVCVRAVGRERRNATDVGGLDTMTSIAVGLMESNTRIRATGEPLTARDIVLLISRNQERRYLKRLLGQRYPDLAIATANKFQGSDRAVSIVLHPLSGKTRADEFAAEAGRLCVMLSRHTHACFVIHRAGIAEMLERSIPDGPRALGGSTDLAYQGWRTNREFARWMRDTGDAIEFNTTAEPLRPTPDAGENESGAA